MKPFIAPWNVSTAAWQFIFTFFAVGLGLMRLLPGGEHRGPVTATGHVPVYTANGVQCFVLHVGLFVLCSNEVSKWLLGDELGYYKLSIVYDELGDVINGCNWFALCFVTMLYIKGHVAPTS